jgi:hypothetical protein
MKFEDLLPAVRVGRLIRRPEWKPGRCIGLSEFDLRNRAGHPPNMTEFEGLDRRGVSTRSWSDLHSSSDLLSDDWEVVPVIANPEREEIGADHLESLRELARELSFSHRPPCDGRKNGLKNLSTTIHELTEAYRSPEPARIRGALVLGILAYTELKKPKTRKDEDDDLDPII